MLILLYSTDGAGLYIGRIGACGPNRHRRPNIRASSPRRGGASLPLRIRLRMRTVREASSPGRARGRGWPPCGRVRGPSGKCAFAASISASSASRFPARPAPWVMIRQARFQDGQRAPHQGLGLRKAVRGLKQLRQIVQVSGHVGMTGAEAFLVDGQRAPHQGLGLRKPVRGLKQQRQIVEARWPHWDDRGRSFPRRWPARAASRARPRQAGSWPEAAAPDC